MWLVLGVSCGLQLLSGLCTGVVVTQNKFAAIQNGADANLPCEHDDDTYDAVLWYQQKDQGQLQLVVISIGMGLCTGVIVTQKEFVAIQNGTDANLPCEHDDGTYFTVLWYQQKDQGQLQLVVISVCEENAAIEEKYKPRYNAMWLVLGVSCGLQLLAAIQNGTNASLPCKHDDESYYYVLWYQQKDQGQLQLVAVPPYLGLET
ncbi:hypothetical protein Y1Q_0015253 [Alligator mississippiensis]|uniref:Immunoglobulin V-set domain-containing protein n=1 Tax=Alligator mississippiensis TaxID=8496 RepID=A0A151NM04_ALLMI|nr:hypothetical protein Y1Q_0015253 [Alligator mississippiensis]